MAEPGLGRSIWTCSLHGFLLRVGLEPLCLDLSPGSLVSFSVLHNLSDLPIWFTKGRIPTYFLPKQVEDIFLTWNPLSQYSWEHTVLRAKSEVPERWEMNLTMPLSSRSSHQEWHQGTVPIHNSCNCNMIGDALAVWAKRLWENKTGSDTLCSAGTVIPGCYFVRNLKKKKKKRAHYWGKLCGWAYIINQIPQVPLNCKNCYKHMKTLCLPV